MWLLICTLLALIAGHMTLLSRFPPVNAPARERFSFASGGVRGVSYRSALHVAISDRGLHLAPNWLFRPITHRGIPCIPWGELRCTKAQVARGGWIPRASRFEIPRVGLRFALYGKPGRAVESALQRARGRARLVR
jgi:hypothetical protein